MEENQRLSIRRSKNCERTFKDNSSYLFGSYQLEMIEQIDHIWMTDTLQQINFMSRCLGSRF
jgi:hypothetical protein